MFEAINNYVRKAYDPIGRGHIGKVHIGRLRKGRVDISRVT